MSADDTEQRLDPNARLDAFGDMLERTGGVLRAPLGIVCLAARLTALAPSSMPFLSEHPDKMMADLAGGRVAPIADPGLPAAIASLDALARHALAAHPLTLGSIEGIWLFAAFAADIVRAASPEERPALVGLYEAARAA